MENDVQSKTNADILVELQRQNTLLENIQVMLEQQEREIAPVRIENFNMPFVSMIGLIIKWVFASIPAGILAGLFLAIVWFFLVVVLGIAGSALF